jgi:hypothetical protein
MSIAVGNVTTTPSSVYTSTGSTAITFLSLCNYSLSNVTASLHVVPSGDTAGNQNMVLDSISLTTLDTYQLYAAGEKLLLDNGDTIQVSASANNSITTVTSYTSV